MEFPAIRRSVDSRASPFSFGAQRAQRMDVEQWHLYTFGGMLSSVGFRVAIVAVVNSCLACAVYLAVSGRLAIVLYCATGMGRSLIVLVSSFCFACLSAQAGSQDALEPYQVVDIRMEEGVKDEAGTQHMVDDEKGPLTSAAFLANQERGGLDRFASIVATQKAESAALSDMLESIKSA